MAATPEVVPTPNIPDFSIDGATSEIPFVPASQRQTTAKPEIIDDAIAVVGQRQKKCKRAAAAAKNADVDSEKSPKAKTEEAVAPFDFASAPNVLDDDEGGGGGGGARGRRGRECPEEEVAKSGVLGAFVWLLVSPSRN